MLHRRPPPHPLAVMALLGGCAGAEETPSPTPSPVLIVWAAAIDPAAPLDPTTAAEALKVGVDRWAAAGAPLVLHYQGASDAGTLANDGLQVLWLWWESMPWAWDPDALVVVQSYSRQGAAIHGFDVVIRGPACPGQATGAALDTSLANVATVAFGQALGVLPSDDPQSAFLGANPCDPSQDLEPTAAELEALRQLLTP